MIKALNHRTKEAVLKLSNKLCDLSDKDIKSSYVKLTKILNNHTQELRYITK